jgi:hypothetical protein
MSDGQYNTHSQHFDVSEECDGTELSDTVLGLIEKEESEAPAWIKEGSNVSKNSSTTDQIKSHLRHIVIPHSIHSYQQLRKDLLSNSNSNSNSNSDGNGDAVEDTGGPSSSSSSSSSSSLTLLDGVDCMIGSTVGSLSAVTSSNSKNSSIMKHFFGSVKSDSNRGDQSIRNYAQHFTTPHHTQGSHYMHVCVCNSLILPCSLSNQGMLSCF